MGREESLISQLIDNPNITDEVIDAARFLKKYVYSPDKLKDVYHKVDEMNVDELIKELDILRDIVK